MAQVGRMPKPGFSWNPLMKLPRNAPCVCGSGKKFKKCHLPAMSPILPTKTVEDLRKKT
jgi:uncharacterized protein YecA (UPF0149 family)